MCYRKIATDGGMAIHSVGDETMAVGIHTNLNSVILSENAPQRFGEKNHPRPILTLHDGTNL